MDSNSPFYILSIEMHVLVQGESYMMSSPVIDLFTVHSKTNLISLGYNKHKAFTMGTVARMSDDRIPKQLLFGNSQPGQEL